MTKVQKMIAAKKRFVNWLKAKKAEDIEEFKGKEGLGFEYYNHVIAIIGDDFYGAVFMIWKGMPSIRYSNEQDDFGKLTIEEFLSKINA